MTPPSTQINTQISVSSPHATPPPRTASSSSSCVGIGLRAAPSCRNITIEQAMDQDLPVDRRMSSRLLFTHTQRVQCGHTDASSDMLVLVAFQSSGRDIESGILLRALQHHNRVLHADLRLCVVVNRTNTRTHTRGQSEHTATGVYELLSTKDRQRSHAPLASSRAESPSRSARYRKPALKSAAAANCAMKRQDS